MSREEGPTYSPGREASMPVVLVVNQDPLMVTLLAAFLTAKNYSVIKAYSAAQAAKIIRQQPVDLVIGNAADAGALTGGSKDS